MKSVRRREALIFDMDGVLWDSSEIHHKAFKAVLEPLGVNVLSYDPLAGLRTDEAIQRLLLGAGVSHDKKEIFRLTALKRDHALKLLELSPPLMPHCFEVLSHLAGRYELALASSASRGSVDLFLKVSKTRSLFKVIICGDDVAAAKPAPDIYLAALKRLGVAAAEAYVIEDSESGIESAVAAGVSVLVFRTPRYRIRANAQIAAAFESLDELMAL